MIKNGIQRDSSGHGVQSRQKVRAASWRDEDPQESKSGALDRFLLQRHGRTWDSVPLPGVKPLDLSLSSLKKFRELAAASSRLRAEDLSASDSGLLEKLKLV